jgi:hypothetical protein
MNLFHIPSWPHWLKVGIVHTIPHSLSMLLKYIFTAAFILYSQWSIAVELPRVMVGYFAGERARSGETYTEEQAIRLGLGYVAAEWQGKPHGWDVFAERVRTQHPEGVWVHNPFGLFYGEFPTAEMYLDQASRLKALAAHNPQSKHLAAKADLELFTRSFRTLPRTMPVIFYVGGPFTFLPQDVKTPKQWEEAAWQELQPIILTAPTAIGFDNEKGEPIWDASDPRQRIVMGPQGGAQRLFDRLRATGIQVLTEPQPLVIAPRYYDNWAVVGDRWYQSHKDDWSYYQIQGRTYPFRNFDLSPRKFRLLDMLHTIPADKRQAHIDEQLAICDHTLLLRATDAPKRYMGEIK